MHPNERAWCRASYAMNLGTKSSVGTRARFTAVRSRAQNSVNTRWIASCWGLEPGGGAASGWMTICCRCGNTWAGAEGPVEKTDASVRKSVVCEGEVELTHDLEERVGGDFRIRAHPRNA